MADIFDLIGEEKDSYPYEKLVQASIHLLTGMSMRKTSRETGVDEITLHWMKVGVWHKTAMQAGYTICLMNKLYMKPSIKEVIV